MSYLLTTLHFQQIIVLCFSSSGPKEVHIFFSYAKLFMGLTVQPCVVFLKKIKNSTNLKGTVS
jgi:hypothetical protein